jgi:hypothetical protein
MNDYELLAEQRIEELRKKADKWDKLMRVYGNYKRGALNPTTQLSTGPSHSHGRYEACRAFVKEMDKILNLIVSGEP